MRVRRILQILALSFHAGRAGAQAPEHSGLSLEWQADATCPSREAVLERVGALLTTERGTAGSTRLQVRGTVTRREAGEWLLTLDITHGARTWQRSLEAQSCDELTDAGALIIALVIDPDAGAATRAATPPTASMSVEPANQDPTQPEPSQPEPPRAVPSVKRPAQSKRAAAARRERAVEQRDRTSSVPAPGSSTRSRFEQLDWKLALGGVVDSGTLPNPMLGVEASAGVGGSVWFVEFMATRLPFTDAVITEEPRRGATFDSWTFGARGCYLRHWSPWVARACMGGEGGWIRATSFGATGWNGSRTAALASGLAAVGARVELGRTLFAELSTEGLVLVRRPEFFIQGIDRVHQPSLLIGRVIAGAGLLF